MIRKALSQIKRSIGIAGYIIFYVLSILIATTSLSFAEVSFEEAKKEGEVFAAEVLDKGLSSAENFEKLKELDGYTENPKEVHLSVEDLKKDKLQETVEKDEVGQLIIQSHGERARDFEDIEKEEWFKQSVEIIDEADKGIQKDGIKGCKKGSVPEVTHIEFDKNTKKYRKKETYLAKATCEKPGGAEYKCQRKLKLKCMSQDQNGCDNKGIVSGTIQTDMKWEYKFPNLTIGTIADNYWGGHCQVYDRPTKFQVSNLDKITEFRIKQVGFDDFLWIKINGITVYVGPHGGDRIELKRPSGKYFLAII